MSDLSNQPYIFIVGVSRSGTSLMRRVLNKSTQIALCDENYYLGHLIPSEGMRFKFRKFGDLKIDSNVKRLVDFMYSPKFYKYSKLKTLNWQWKWFVTEIPKNVMLERLLATDRTEKGFFSLLMELFAANQGALVRGEKTPAHIRYVETIFSWYPQATVLHMMRDPRAIFVSEVRRRKEKSLSPPYKQLKHVPFLLNLFLLLQVSWTWSDGLKRLRISKAKFGDQYRVVFFEELIGNPEGVLRELCGDLDLEFQESMMTQSVISEGFQAGKKGFDAKAAKRWKNKIPSWVNWFLSKVFNKPLVEFGYEEA